MTKEEALQYEHYFDIIYNLSQTCGVSSDFIEGEIKQAIIDTIAKTSVYGKELGYEVAHDILFNLPPTTPSYNSIKTELEPCDDCISRQALIDALINATDICVRSGEVGKEEGERHLSESIRWIKSLPPVNPVEKQDSCEDCISRRAVLNVMRENHRSGGRDVDGDYIEGDYRESLYDDIVSLPPVNPIEKQESCKNAISRVDTLKLIYDFKEKHIEDRKKHPINYGTLLDLIRLIRELPPVNPTEKVGWWIIYDVHGHKACKCSECDRDVSYPCNDKFCKYCGSKMQEEE